MRLSATNACDGQDRRLSSAPGFSLLELMVSTAILLIVFGSIGTYLSSAVQRSQAEQTKIDLTQQAREFVDEFERDIHQSGYPNCWMFNTGSNCSAHFSDSTVATGLVSVSNTQVVFEGDVDGSGVVNSVWYRLVDSSGNYPPTGTCPCTIQRSQTVKVNGTAPLSQSTTFSQELQNVVNSGVPAAGSAYGGGLAITSNTAAYSALSLKDFPVFSAYDQNGNLVTLPADITTAAGQQTLSTIKSIRLTITLLGSATTGYDLKTRVLPVMTLVGTGRINNCSLSTTNC